MLSGLNLQLQPGSVLTVIGPNGASKSTLLNALMGVLPARGEIVFDGQSLQGASLEDRVMQGIALVPEKRELFTTMPVEDNLVLGGYRPCACANASGWRRSTPSTSSSRASGAPPPTGRHALGGERQMLALGRALMSHPSC